MGRLSGMIPPVIVSTHAIFWFGMIHFRPPWGMQ